MLRNCLAIVLLLMYVPAWGATFYVDATGGNDGNAGIAINNAWKTISKVNSSLFSAGDQILFKKGETWSEQLTIPSSGSTGNPITFGAYGTGSLPVISGADIVTDMTEGGTGVYQKTGVTTQPYVCLWIKSGTITRLTYHHIGASVGLNEWDWDADTLYVNVGENPSGGTVKISQRPFGIVQNKSNIIIQDLQVEMANNIAGGGIFNWINTGTTYNIIIQRCTVRYNSSSGIRVSNGHTTIKTENVLIDSNIVYENGNSGIDTGVGVNNLTISNNAVHHNTWRTTDHHAGIHHFGNQIDGSGIVIEKNDVYSSYFSGGTPLTKGNGIHIDEAAGSPGPTVRYNKVYNNGQSGIFIEHTKSGAEIYYNICYGNSPSTTLYGAGIYIYRGVQGAHIYNNVAYGNNTGIASIGATSGDTYDNNHFKNNIATGNTRQLWAQDGGANDGGYGSGNVYTNNCFGAASANFIRWAPARDYSTYATWETAYGGITNTVQSGPKFVNAAGANFQLLSTSPAINAGTSVSLTTDYAGNSIQGFPDIGAYEYQVILRIPSSPGSLRIN